MSTGKKMADDTVSDDMAALTMNADDALNKTIRTKVFFNDPHYSDVKVICSHYNVFAHRVILATNSPWFHRVFQSEALLNADGDLDFGPDVDRDMIDIMIRHMYGLTPDPQDTSLMSEEETGGPLNFNFILYTMADKYDVPSLRALAAKDFIDSMDEEIAKDNFAFIIRDLFGHKPAHILDCSIRELVIEKLAQMFAEVCDVDELFVDLLEHGELLDTEYAGKLLLKLAKERPLRSVG